MAFTSFGISLDGNVPLSYELDFARRAEDSGLGTLWTQENFYLRDGITTAAAVLARTSRITVMAGTLSPYTRHPIVYGMSVARLQEMSGGRAGIVIGSGTPETLERMGLEHRAPLAHVRECIEILRAYFSGERVRHSGAAFDVRQLRLTTGRLEPQPKIYLAGVGPRMLQLAGEIADGAVIGVSTARYAAWARTQVVAGARKASRDPAEVEIVSHIPVSAGVVDAADPIPHFHARHLLGFHLSSDYYRPIVDATGLDVDTQEIRDVFGRRDWARLERVIPDDVLRHFVVYGDDTAWDAGIGEYAAAGVDVPIFFFVEAFAARRATMDRALEYVRTHAA